MTPERLRWILIGLLTLAAVLSVVGNKTGSHFISSLSFAAFIGGVLLYVDWRRRVAARRRARVFDREAKTDETRTGPDE